MGSVTLFAILIMALPEESSPYHKELRAVDNRVIRWEGTHFGLVPVVNKEVETTCKRLVGQPGFYQALYDFLSDESRFVAAHVLLRRCVPRVPPGRVSIDHYCGLTIKVDEDGKVFYPDPQRQMRFLRAYWKRVLLQNKLLLFP